MKRNLLILICSILILSCNNDNLPNEFEACDPGPHFDIDLFVDIINDRLQSKPIAGYQFAVTKDGNLYHSEAFGFARYKDDPGGEIPMTPTTRQNIASVSKFVGAIALMNAMEEAQISLDTSVVAHLPDSWQSTIHPDFSDEGSAAYLTFESLLTMKTAIDFQGKIPPSGSMQSEAEMLASLQQPPNLGRLDTYQNGNFTLIRVLIGEIVYNLNENGIQYPIYCTDRYFDYIRETIFNPLEIYAPLSPPEVSNYYNNTNYPLAYTYPFSPVPASDGNIGWQYDHNWENAGSSGLLLSSIDLAKLLAFFKYDTNALIISETQRELIFQRRLGLRTTKAFDDRPYAPYYAKNGAKSDDCNGCGRALRSIIIFFPNDVEVALLINFNRNGIGTLVADAYDDAFVEVPCVD